MNKNLKTSIEAIAELFGWSCHWDEDENLELENWSPAGEDLVEYGQAPDVIKDFVRNARSFDIDEHVEMWISARGNVRGVPSAKILVKDASEIEEMLNDLADALEILGAAFKEGHSPIEYLYISDVRDVIEKREPKGLFITRDGEKYVGIDNQDGDTWTEECDQAKDCIEWLCNRDKKRRMRRMVKIRPEDIHYSYDTRGYMMYYKNKPIGGAGISKEAKGCRANLKLFQNCADIDKRGILAGRETRYINEIRRIEREIGKTKEEVKNRLLSGETLGDMFQITDGQECEIFKAKSFVDDGSVIYIPDLYLNEIYEYVDHAVKTDREEETDEIIDDIVSCCYTAADFIEMTGGDTKKAERLFAYCDWQHPSSALPEIEEEELE